MVQQGNIATAALGRAQNLAMGVEEEAPGPQLLSTGLQVLT